MNRLQQLTGSQEAPEPREAEVPYSRRLEKSVIVAPILGFNLTTMRASPLPRASQVPIHQWHRITDELDAVECGVIGMGYGM